MTADNIPPNHWLWSREWSRCRLVVCPSLWDRDTSNSCSMLKSRWQGSWPAGVHLQPIQITIISNIPSPSHKQQLGQFILSH